MPRLGVAAVAHFKVGEPPLPAGGYLFAGSFALALQCLQGGVGSQQLVEQGGEVGRQGDGRIGGQPQSGRACGSRFGLRASGCQRLVAVQHGELFQFGLQGGGIKPALGAYIQQF